MEQAKKKSRQKTKPKGPKRRRAALTAELRSEVVLGLRLQGLSDRQIAKRIKQQYGSDVSHVTVNRDWKKALATRRDENDEDFIDFLDTQNLRYERLMSTWFPYAIAGHGRAAEVVLRTIKAIREMNGLDAPDISLVAPIILEQGDREYDLTKLSTDEQQQMASLAKKAEITDITKARERFGT